MYQEIGQSAARDCIVLIFPHWTVFVVYSSLAVRQVGIMGEMCKSAGISKMVVMRQIGLFMGVS